MQVLEGTQALCGKKEWEREGGKLAVGGGVIAHQD
jgi:hypothetical protein